MAPVKLTPNNTVMMPVQEMFRLSYDTPVSVSDIAIQTVLDEAFYSDTFYITPYNHSHPYFELHIGIAGEYAITFMEHPTVYMRPSMFCLIPPELCHSTQYVSPNAQKLAIRFSYCQTRAKADFAPLYASFHKVFNDLNRPFSTCSDGIFQLMQLLRQETLNKRQGSDVLEQQLLSQLYVYLMRILLPPENSVTNNASKADSINLRYLHIDKFLTEHCCQNITERDLANYISLSTRQTGRILQTIYGMGFQEKLTDMRLVRAAGLLSETKMPLEEIARSVGYTSYSGFYMAFRKRFGMTGKEYRLLNEGKTFTDETS